MRLGFLAGAVFLFIVAFGLAILGIGSLAEEEETAAEDAPEVRVLSRTVGFEAQAGGLADAGFSGIDVSLSPELVRMDGFLTAAGSPIEPAVIMVCEGVQISEEFVPVDGFFSIASNRGCDEGKWVWLETVYRGKLVESDYYKIPGQEKSSGRDRETVKSPVPVPEYSLGTLFAAVVIACLGIAVMRR